MQVVIAFRWKEICADFFPVEGNLCRCFSVEGNLCRFFSVEGNLCRFSSVEGSLCRFFRWKEICAGLYCLFISVLSFDVQLS